MTGIVAKAGKELNFSGIFFPKIQNLRFPYFKRI